MEFKFQPKEDNKATPTYFSSSSNYFAEQAMRAGSSFSNGMRRTEFMGNQDPVSCFSNGIRRTEFMGNQDPVREAIQREIEKERIREEIITAEIIRKRVLEAEVRREMALERELGFPLAPTSLNYQHNIGDNSRFQERFSFSSRSEIGNFNSLPFQRHPEAAKIFEAKPMNPNITGIKRKLLAIGGANELAVGSSKKKPHKEWSCALCKVSATSEQGLNSHLQGKKHKAKEAELIRANGAASKDIDSPSPFVSSKKSENLELSKNSNSSKANHGKKTVQVKKKNGKATLQKKEATSEQGVNDHLQGKKNEVEEVESRSGTTSKGIDSSVTLPEKIVRPEVSQIDSSPKPHHGVKPVKAMKKKKNGEAAFQKKQSIEDLKKKFKFWCEDCRIGCQSATVMADHENGKKHQTQLLAPKKEGGGVKQWVSKNERTAVQKNQMTEDFKKKFKFWCEQCQVGCHSASTMAHHERGKKHMAQIAAPKEDGGDVLATTSSNSAKVIAGKAGAVEEASDDIMESVDGEVDGGEEIHETGKVLIPQLLAPKEDGGNVLATTNTTATNSTETTVGKAEAVKEASEEMMENVDGEVDGGEEPQERGKVHIPQLPAPKEDGGDVLEFLATTKTNTTASNTNSTKTIVGKAEAVKEASEEMMENVDGEVDGGEEPHERGKVHIPQLPTPKEDGGDVLVTTKTNTTATASNTNSTETIVGKAEAVKEASEEMMENVDGEVDGGNEPHERGKEHIAQLPAPKGDSGDVLATTNATEATVGKAEAVEESGEEIMENVDGEVDGGEEPDKEALEMKVTSEEVAEAEKRI